MGVIMHHRLYTMLVQITSKYFCAGLEIDDKNTCILAPPIVKYMVGWNKLKIENYCKTKKWKLKHLEVDTKNWKKIISYQTTLDLN
jgi:hypothetical protein